MQKARTLPYAYVWGSLAAIFVGGQDVCSSGPMQGAEGCEASSFLPSPEQAPMYVTPQRQPLLLRSTLLRKEGWG